MQRISFKTIFLGLGALLLLGYIIYSDINATIQTETAKQPIKIGAIYTLTGMLSDIGKALQEGTQIAVEEINAAGGIQGQPLEVIYEDDPDYNPSAAVSAAQKLIAINKVRSVLAMPYTGLSSIKTFAEQYKTPVINVIDSSDQIASYGDWVFSTGLYDEGVGEQVALYAREKLSVSKAAVLAGQDEYIYAFTDGFTRKFKSTGGTLTLREEFPLGATDFRTALLKIIDSGAEAIFVGHVGEGGLVVKQARELGFKGYFLGGDPFSLGEVSKAAGSYLNDSTYFGLWRNFDSETDAQKAFATRYEKRFGKKAGDYLFYNTLGYDGMMALADAMKRSDLSGEGIKKELYNVKNFPGLSGPISIDEQGVNRDPKSAIVTYKNGVIVRAQ